MVTFPAKLTSELLKVGDAIVDGEQALGARRLGLVSPPVAIAPGVSARALATSSPRS